MLCSGATRGFCDISKTGIRVSFVSVLQPPQKSFVTERDSRTTHFPRQLGTIVYHHQVKWPISLNEKGVDVNDMLFCSAP